MHVLKSTFTDAAHNIATEEFLFKKFKGDVMFLYRNKPSVILGKHQNAFSEVDRTYAEANQVDVIRRLSGGGSVYHDLGNLNFTQIKRVSGQNKVDFVGFLEPMIQFLKKLNVDVWRNDRNNIMVEDKKITGTACHTFKDRVMHHGTLLFSADLDALHYVLTPTNSAYSSKAVKSVPSKVTLLSNHLKEAMDIADFESYIYNEYRLLSTTQELVLSSSDLDEIEQLVKEKYSTWKWNFAYSPKFTFKGDYKSSKVELRIEKGTITQGKKLEDGNWVDVDYIGTSFE